MTQDKTIIKGTACKSFICFWIWCKKKLEQLHDAQWSNSTNFSAGELFKQNDSKLQEIYYKMDFAK